MPTPTTTVGTPKLSEVARHVVAPTGIVSTGWPAVRDTCKGFGVTFDGWQHGAGRLILAKRDGGEYAAGIGGVVLSIPRQVGKTFLVGAIVFALCLLKPGTTVLWTAHRLKTANETFSKMQAFAGRRKVKPNVAKIVLGSGDEAIEFHNGSRILFGARERGFGRGFDDVDIEVFDEAQILTESAIDDMVPATNAAKNPLLLFMGTPPRPKDPSEVFNAKRTEALSRQDHDTAYIEFSADPGADPEDREQWAKANPSYPGRTSESAMLRMKKNLTPSSFMREGLGIWDDDIDGPQWKTITRADWVGCGVAMEPDEAGFLSGPITLAIEMDAGSRLTHLIAAGAHDDVVGVDLHATFPNPREVVPYLLELKAAAEIRVVLDKRGPASSLLNELTEAGIEVDEVDTPTLMRGTGAFIDAATDQQVRHRHRPALDEAIGRATLRKYGESRLINRAGDGDPSVAIGAVLAHLAHVAAATEPEPFAGVVYA